MRTLTCVATILLLSGAVMAAETPIDKGSMIVGGTAYFMTQSGDLWEVGDEATTTIGLMPSIGYFVAPSIMIGGEVQFISLSIGGSDLTTFAVGPMVGYYFNLDQTRTEVKGAIHPYIKAFFSYGQISNGSSIDQMSFGGQGGAVFMLSNAIGLDAGVRFQSDSWKPEGADESTTGTTIWVGAGITAFLW